MVHRTGALLLTALDDLSAALERAEPPVPTRSGAVGGSRPRGEGHRQRGR
ncbi:hypothetical protein ACQB60_19415 [Actinomycetota bacterium Odt1-20B]